MKKRFLSIVLVLTFIIGIVPLSAVPVQASGLSLQDLMAKFPDGGYWNGGNVDSYTWTPCTSHNSCDYYGGCNCNSFSNAIQCHGFALKLGYDAFGSNPRNWTRASSPYSYIYSLKPGDIVTSDSPYHTFFVIGVTSSSVTIGECNRGGRCIIKWGRSIDKATIAGYSGLAIYIAPATLDIGTHTVHSYTSSVTTNPTCISAGVRTYRCSCGNSYTESIPALGHDYTGDRLYESAHPHQISQRCVRYSSCGGFYWTGENYFLSGCSTCLAENQKQIHSSQNSATVYLGFEGAESQTIYFWSSGYYNGNCSYRWERSNQNVSLSWGEWTEDNRLPLTITALSIGTTALTISIIDRDTEAVLDSMTINVTVDVYAFSFSENTSNSATISTAGQMKYYIYTPSTSGTYVIYSTGSEDTKVYLYNSNGSQLDSDDDGGDGNNFRLEYNLIAGTKYIFGVRYYSSSKTGIISFKFGNVYTVTYNANGGTGAPSSQKKDYDTNITLSSILPTRTGYTFKGWAKSSSATSVEYQPDATYSLNANATLYAVWEVNPTALRLNSSNGAVISTGGEMKYYIYTPSTSGTYVIYSTCSEDTEVYVYNSNGSQLDSDDDGGDGNNFRLEYNLIAGTKYIFGVRYYSSSKTGIISFKFGNVYTVTYNANGGTGSPSSQKKDYGANITLSSILPTRTGYTFKGWAKSSSATSVEYQPDATYSLNANATLYAVWEKIPVTLTAVAVGTMPSKTTYKLGETLDISGLSLKLTYSDGSTKAVTSGFTASVYNFNKAGVKTVIVSYDGKSTSFAVTVIPVAPDALALNENSNYKINETIGAVVVNPADKSGESLNAFMKNIATDHAYIQITDAIGNIKTSVSRLSTGYKVQILETDGSIKKTYTIVILGDTDGNGRYTLADVSGVQGYVITKPVKNTIDFLVADIDGNSRLSFVDASMLQKFM